MAGYLGLVVWVAAARMKAATPTQSGKTMYQKRSPVLSACHALKNVVMIAST